MTAVGAWRQIEVAALQGATADDVVPCGKSRNPAVVPVEVNVVADAVPANAKFPPALSVEVADGVWDACDPAPVIRAVLVSDAALVTQVAQAIVPLVVKVPPVIGEVVATLVTVPVPVGAAHVLSPRKKVVPLGVPVALKSAIAIKLDVA